jgi:protein SCO1
MAVAGCGGGLAGDSVALKTERQPSVFRGAELAEPVVKPSTQGLVDQLGQPYDLATRTRHEVALVFVGYTHCPDECPMTMATLALAVRKLSPDERAMVQVVFITADPVRDTPKRLRQWLAQFDRSFVGLTGSVQRLDSIAASIGIAAFPPTYEPDGTVDVEHGDQVVGFGADGAGRVMWTAGTPAADFAHDLKLLVYDQS